MGKKKPLDGFAAETAARKAKDNLTLDAIDAQQAGMSYGQYKALHPNTAFANESRLRAKPAPQEQQQRVVVRAVYTKICPECGKEFTTNNLQKIRCSEQCQNRHQNQRHNQRRKEREAQT